MKQKKPPGDAMAEIPIALEQTTGLERIVLTGAPKVCPWSTSLHHMPCARDVNHGVLHGKGNCLPLALGRGRETMNL